VRRHDDYGNRIGACGARQFGHQWPWTFIRGARRKDEHGDVFIRLNQFEDFPRTITLADHCFRQFGRDALGERREAIEQLLTFC
jgi:hypothetical protein